jgi:hypothetical protein
LPAEKVALGRSIREMVQTIESTIKFEAHH